MKKIKILMTLCLLAVACSKKNDALITSDVDGVTSRIEVASGITYRVFLASGSSAFKGMLVMGSGNDESNPTVGAVDGGAETDLCNKAAKNGYLGAIVQYRKTPGLADWNASATQIGQDYDQCITALSAKYGVAKTKSVVGGVSYASFMLLTDNSLNNTLSYCQGLLAPCGATSAWGAQNFKIPVFSVACSGNNEGDYAGLQLYNQITNPAIKAKSGGLTDNSCSTHCGGSWTDLLYGKMVIWLQ